MVLIAGLLVLALAAPVALGAERVSKESGDHGNIGQAGNSNNAFTELVTKNPDTWEVDTQGAWAKLKYGLTGDVFDFHLNAHGLEAGVAYALIYYPDPWPGEGLIVLGEAVADEDGNLLIKGSAETGTLPGEGDENTEGAKIWLVLSADLGEGSMVGWNPTGYLFEYSLINYDAGAEAGEEPEVEAGSADTGKPDKEKSNNGLAKGKNK
jgi:hypothetical protein